METRTTLLNHAEDLSRSVGFNGFSFADLSAGAGIRKASVHYHFATKSDLAQALIARYRGDVAQALGALSGTAAAQLRGFLAVYRTALGNGETVCLCVAMSASRDSFDAATLGELNRFQADVIDWLAQVFKTAMTDRTIADVALPLAEAQAAMALVEGAQLMARAASEPALFDAATALLVARTAKETP